MEPRQEKDKAGLQVSSLGLGLWSGGQVPRTPGSHRLSLNILSALTPTEETHLFAVLQRMNTHFTIASDGNPFL